MKITGQGNTIIVETRGKVLVIHGELTTTPVFYADTASIKNWETPYENVEISDEEKLEIINEIKEYNKHQEIKIIFN